MTLICAHIITIKRVPYPLPQPVILTTNGRKEGRKKNEEKVPTRVNGLQRQLNYLNNRGIKRYLQTLTYI